MGPKIKILNKGDKALTKNVKMGPTIFEGLTEKSGFCNFKQKI